MIIVTGAAGFIGSNLVKALNDRGEADILAVDDLTDGRKFHNLADCRIADYWDKDALLAQLSSDTLGFKPRAILHQGACATTTEWDGRYMMATNYEYSKALLAYSQRHGVPFIYASSASVYGAGPRFKEDIGAERPLNVYGYSKFLLDRWVEARLPASASQIVGLRYFNVYGPGEAHKGSMASVAFHFDQQIRESGVARLFAGSDGYAAGEQRRDFIYVGDVAAVNLWFLEHPDRSGIFNVGTGAASSFNALAKAVIAHHGKGEIQYIEFPKALQGRYQSFTEADVPKLRQAGYAAEFLNVEQGVKQYLDARAASS
jgi:ADP-L-glycero-D-manno-heptose 6-epimerase